MPGRKRRFTLFRVVYEPAAGDPLPARQSQGRFHMGEDQKSQTYYLSEEEATCWAEIEHHRGEPVDRSRYKVFRIKVTPSKVVDLTDVKVQEHYGITRAQLEDELHREPCQALGARLRAEGVQAARTFSAPRRDAVNVVLFAENLAPSCALICKETASTVSRRTP